MARKAHGLTPQVAWEAVVEHGSIRSAATALGVNESTLRKRIGKVRQEGVNDGKSVFSSLKSSHNHADGRLDLNIQNGTVVVFSDAHFEPGVDTTTFRALKAVIKQLRPVAVICNGDAFDGGTISRYPRIGWDKKPSVAEELDAVNKALSEIRQVSGTAKLVWPLGNHDARYETYLAANAPQYEGVQGFSLKDRFLEWSPCWTCWINEETCVTHFYHTGMHAVWNNLMKGQVNYVSSHRHTPEVRAYTNAAGRTIYGVDTGTLNEALGAHNVDYQCGRHGNHRSAFAVLTYKDGKLLMPELVQKYDEDSVQFRGHVLNADTLEVV